ncbi:MAG: hypothetical protein HKO66_02845 [Saprospiraceae bacterium]|nr:hypothetical protein [Saprospiraceae bacterium]
MNKLFDSLIILVLISNYTFSQKVIIDTSAYFSYNCYKQELVICKYLVPDSIYEKYSGEVSSTDNIGYFPHCFNIAYEGDKAHTFEDFEICFKQECFQFNYPSYKFYLNKNELVESLENIILVSTKNKSFHKPKKIIFKLNDGTEIEYDKNVIYSKLEILKLKQQLYNTVKIGIQIPPFTYPYNSEEEDCGQNLIKFNLQEFVLFGKDIYEELKIE